MTIHALDKNFLIKEIPVAYRDRPEGSVSKLNTVSDGIKVLKTVSTLFKDYKPFCFFTTAAVCLWLIAVILLVPVFQSYFATGLVLRFPTLIAGGFIAVAGMLLWICGIILQVVIKKHRQQYELMLNQIK